MPVFMSRTSYVIFFLMTCNWDATSVPCEGYRRTAENHNFSIEQSKSINSRLDFCLLLVQKKVCVLQDFTDGQKVILQVSTPPLGSSN